MRRWLLPLLAAMMLASGCAVAQEAETPAAEPAGEPAPAEAAPASPESPQPAGALPTLVAVRVSNTPERARLIVDLSGRTQFAIVSIADPDRIAVDVRASETAIVGNIEPAGEGIVARASVELAEAGRARTTLFLSRAAQVQQAYILEAFEDQPARLVVDLILDTEEGFAARAAADLANSIAHPGGVTEAPLADDSTAPGHSELVADSNKPLIVIDPGHGGIDNGASTPDGVREKDIVLSFALKLQDVLVKTGKYEVALTRDDDTFLRLEDRVALARAHKADLFVSLHADSFQQPDVRGASVYTRDERATDVLDHVLAENENRADIVAGFTVPETSPAVVDILVDLMRREMRRQSFLAAEAIVAQLEPSVTLRRFPVRQADFFVLQAPDVPSVLVELGFLSNAEDIVNLRAEAWQERVVDALARGVATYFDAP